MNSDTCNFAFEARRFSLLDIKFRLSDRFEGLLIMNDQFINVTDNIGINRRDVGKLCMRLVLVANVCLDAVIVLSRLHSKVFLILLVNYRVGARCIN